VLRSAAEKYFAGLANSDFEAIPFAETVVLRVPLAPGGSARPLAGRAAAREIWWPPLKGAVGSVEILDHYFNEAETEVCTRALVRIAGTEIVLRVADWFKVNADGLITEQENHFDPRDVTTPGWATV
jgi:hypothetical protein